MRIGGGTVVALGRLLVFFGIVFAFILGKLFGSIESGGCNADE